jgi:hypothetical protein
MRAKVLRQNMQQRVLCFLKINPDLLLLFRVEVIKIKESAPGQTPPIFQRVQNLGGLIGKEGIGRPESVPQLDHPFPPARGARRRRGMVELADFQSVVAVCLVVGRHVYPRCSRKKRTGESREKNAEASVTEQRSRQQRRPVVHAVKHHSTLRTNTDVSVRSAEKCTLVWNEVRKRNCSSWSVRELNAGRRTCLDPRDTEAQEPAVCTVCSRLHLALHARRDPLRDEIREVGRGLSLADTQTGRYGRLYSRRRLCARRGADARLLLQILLELVQPLATLASPRVKYLIPIPVPVQYRLTRCLE